MTYSLTVELYRKCFVCGEILEKTGYDLTGRMRPASCKDKPECWGARAPIMLTEWYGRNYVQ